MVKSPRPSSSDARYIFILFALIFVVLFFAFLIYFVYWQKQFTARLSNPETTQENTIDTVRTGGKQQDSAPAETAPKAVELAPVNTATPQPTVTAPASFDPSRATLVQLRHSSSAGDTTNTSLLFRLLIFRQHVRSSKNPVERSSGYLLLLTISQ